MLRRPITSGSRQAPDPFDQFLESRFLYRKHTARDASCLFRVIAEQMYDTQTLHYEVRLECVRFMMLKRRIFEKHIDGDFDAYMLDMSKPKTYGTMLELRAMCCMYRRNVILFEPFNMGSLVTFNSRFIETFRVFYTNECHYDSIFVLDYIETAAVCQSISFNVLYKMLYKLPDVGFAVEAMLHPHSFIWGDYQVQFDDNGYVVRLICRDGRVFKLDLPDTTKCILENFKLCNFHNTVKQNQNQTQTQTMLPMTGKKRELKLTFEMGRVLDKMPHCSSSKDLIVMCPNRLTSCVRQLLDDGITPFPYKVAKSLDPFMYRNIEFDCWNDLRKEAKRFNSYAGDYNFKVGAKCRVELDDDSLQMYTCHIQKISRDKSYCIVYVEHFGKKLLVPYEAMHPLPPDEFRPWTLPYRYQRQMQKIQVSKFVHKTKMGKWKKAKIFDMDSYFEASKCENMDEMLHNYPHASVNCLEYPYFAGDHAGQHAMLLPATPKSATELAQQKTIKPECEPHQYAQKPQQQQLQQQSLPPPPPQPAPLQQEPQPIVPPAASQPPMLDMEERLRYQRYQEVVARLMPPNYQPHNGPATQQPAGQYTNYLPLLVGNSYPTLAAPWHANPVPPVGMPTDDIQNAYGQPSPPSQLSKPLNNGGVFVPFGYPAPPPPPPPPPMNMLPLPNPMEQSAAFMAPPPPLPPYAGMEPMRATLPVPPNSPVMPHSNIGNQPNTDKPKRGPFMKPADGDCNEGVEVRRSLRINGDDLPDDVAMLRYFYNMGVDMHLRMQSGEAMARLEARELPGRNIPSLEELRSLGLAPVDFDVLELNCPKPCGTPVPDKTAAEPAPLLFPKLDQQDKSQTSTGGGIKNESVDEAAALVVATTPPPSPDGHPGAAAGNNELAAATTKVGSNNEQLQQHCNNSNKQTRNNNNNNRRTFNKQRAKRQDNNNNINNNNAVNTNGNFHFDFKDIMAHTVLLPTPTSSPTAGNGAQFTFFPTAQAPPSPMQLLQPPPPPVFFTREAAAAQNPFAWGMAPPPPANMLGMPFELHAANFMNHVEAMGANQNHGHLPPPPPPPPLAATQLPQPIYTAGRH